MKYRKTQLKDEKGRVVKEILTRTDGSIVDDEDEDFWDALDYCAGRFVPERKKIEFEEEVDVFVGRMVKVSRTRSRMSQGELAAAIGIAEDTVSRIERGRRSLRVSELIKVAGMTQTPIEKFLIPPEEVVRTGWEPKSKKDVSLSDLLRLVDG
jgi:DNA-binding XRE family transcriptional regulator